MHDVLTMITNGKLIQMKMMTMNLMSVMTMMMSVMMMMMLMMMIMLMMMTILTDSLCPGQPWKQEGSWSGLAQFDEHSG